LIAEEANGVGVDDLLTLFENVTVTDSPMVPTAPEPVLIDTQRQKYVYLLLNIS